VPELSGERKPEGGGWVAIWDLMSRPILKKNDFLAKFSIDIKETRR